MENLRNWFQNASINDKVQTLICNSYVIGQIVDYIKMAVYSACHKLHHEMEQQNSTMKIKSAEYVQES
jgi:fumarate reductase subunit D